LKPGQLVRPLWLMRRCIYGHKLSGHIFVNAVLDLLKDNGFRIVGKSGAMLMRGSVLVCVYVDDLKAAGELAELAGLWRLLRTKFPNLTFHEE